MAERLDAIAIGSHARPISEKPKHRAFYEADSLHTEIYDALGASLVADSPVQGDTAFYRRLASETGGPILEVGCGTGRVAAALAADGHEVVGVDLSAPMLRLAERRREALPAAVAARLSFHRADLATLDLGRDFALIVTPARVFQFMLTSAAQRAALAALRTHLRPNGRLVLDLFDPRLDRVVTSDKVTTRGGELMHPTTGNRVTWEITGRRPDSRGAIRTAPVRCQLGADGHQARLRCVAARRVVRRERALLEAPRLVRDLRAVNAVGQRTVRWAGYSTCCYRP